MFPLRYYVIIERYCASLHDIRISSTNESAISISSYIYGEFKCRYNNHTNSFQNQDYKNKTELSKHIWLLKRNGTEVNLKWSIAAYASPYRCDTSRCELCLTEKYIIARANQNNFLNKRTELISKCWHRN